MSEEEPPPTDAEQAPAEPTMDELEERRAYARAYRERHAEKIAVYRARYNEKHREEIRAKNRDYMRRKAKEEVQKRARRASSARYYVRNRERYIEGQKRSVAKRRAENPDRFRELARGRYRRWWARHKDTENTKRRDAYRRDPEAQRRRAQEYYAAHKEEIKARRRASYAANRDQERATQEAARTKRRAERRAGLPPRQVRRTPREERFRNVRAADDFFTRYRTQEQRQALAGELRTEPALIAAWMRDCLRARALHHQAVAREEAEVLRREGRLVLPKAPSVDEIAKRAEEERMDAVAREINDRLRSRDAPRREAPAPHQMLRPDGGTGLSL